MASKLLRLEACVWGYFCMKAHYDCILGRYYSHVQLGANAHVASTNRWWKLGFDNDSTHRILHLRSSGTAIVLPVYRYSSYKEGPAGSVSWWDAFFCQHQLLCSASRTGLQLRTWATMLKGDTWPGPRAFGCAQWRNDLMEIASETAKALISQMWWSPLVMLV